MSAQQSRPVEWNERGVVVLPVHDAQRHAPIDLSSLRARALRRRRGDSDAPMKYRVTMSIEIEARTDREAREDALKLKELLKSPFVRMAVEGQGIRLSGDGSPVVHAPQHA